MTEARVPFEDGLSRGFSGERCHHTEYNANSNRVWTAHDL